MKRSITLGLRGFTWTINDSYTVHPHKLFLTVPSFFFGGRRWVTTLVIFSMKGTSTSSDSVPVHRSYKVVLTTQGLG